MENLHFNRSYHILAKKFLQYFFPVLITTVALSLNEFVDSIMVANLLDSHAMAIVNLGFPVMLLIAAIYTLFGVGGSTVYSVALGERNQGKAGKTLYLSLISAGALGFIVMIVGLLLPNLIIPMLCQEPKLMEDFTKYFRVLVLSAPFLTLTLTFTEFLPPSGAPQLATTLTIVANVVNLVMDYVYIRYFNMGVEGTAWATVTGYAVGLILLPFLISKSKANIRFMWAKIKDLPVLVESVSTGAATAASQLGFTFKFAVCNALACIYGGTVGVVAFSFCIQALAIISVIYGGIIGSAMPLLAVLRGQRDFSGMRYVLKQALMFSAAFVLVFVLWFEIAPEQAASVYDITAPEELAVAAYGLRVFALCIILRGLCIIFMYYLQVLGEKRYAMAISLFDGVVGIIPLAFIMCEIMGLDGLWWAFTVNSAILLVGILLWNRRLMGTKYEGILLIEKEDPALNTQDFTMTSDEKNISEVTKEVAKVCQSHGITPKNANLVGLLLEEMAIYSKNHHRITENCDVLIHTYDDRIEIDFRSLGDSCNPLEDTEFDERCNLTYLRNISSSIEYDYVMGMNSTHIVLLRRRDKSA